MVTEVQSKMYVSEYYSNLSNGAAGYGGWSLPHESNSLKNGQHFGMYLSAPLTNGMNYDDYEKEKLRQTIMKHESIFRHQVHELHRLYKKQRDLMNEVRSKEQSSRFSSGFHYEDDKRSWCASSFPVAGPTYGRPSLSSVVDVNQSPQSSVKVTSNGSRLREYEPLDLNFKKPQRRLFDLEVPADKYFDDESEVEEEFTKCREVTHTVKKNLPNQTSSDVNALRPNSHSTRTHNLADLNEPIEVDELSESASDHNLGNEIFSKEQRQTRVGSTHVYSNMWSAAKQLSENRNFGKNGVINNLRLKSESSEQGCLPFSVQPGQIIKNKSCFGGVLPVEEFRKPGDSSRVEASKAQVKRRIFGVEVAEGTNDASSFASKVINLDDSEPSSTLSWTKPEIVCQENGSSFVEPRKVETPQTMLPWLRASPLLNGKSIKEESRVGPSVQDSSSTTQVHDAENRRVETSDCSSVKTILGFPIFDFACKTDSVKPKSGDQLKDTSFVRHQIDLNECVVEDEAPIMKPKTTGIDLEAPFILETDSDEEFLEKNPFDSLGREQVEDTTAAEALIAIASSCLHNLRDKAATAPHEESLHLLADIIISSHKDNSEEDSILDDTDEFEQIIMNLPETELEECSYVPPPDERASAPAPRRARRGQARRGRQKIKDFQSEVLPGMVSLSRNEVTEDLQMIEGLVRATGGTWQSSLTLRGRSGGGRGRRRSVGSCAPPPPNEATVVCQVQGGDESKEAGIEETSLTGWGKRTRRPPRQRCPISNSLLPLK